MSSIALGTIVFQRDKKLQNLLKSVDPKHISTVYIADNGHTEEREWIYSTDFQFELHVIDMDFDIGIGACRRAIAERCEEKYLLVTDCDMLVPGNFEVLRDQLDASPEFGGIAGIIRENGKVHSGYCHDLFEEETYKGTVLKGDIRTEKEVSTVAGAPLVPFDFIVNCALFRTECFDDYVWDDSLKFSAHEDFFVGHKHADTWNFGVCTDVIFEHDPGGGVEYDTEYRFNKDRLAKYTDIFLDKWGYEQMVYGPGQYWIGVYHPPSPVERTKNFLKGVLSTSQHVILFDVAYCVSNLQLERDPGDRETVPDPR